MPGKNRVEMTKYIFQAPLGEFAMDVLLHRNSAPEGAFPAARSWSLCPVVEGAYLPRGASINNLIMDKISG